MRTKPKYRCEWCGDSLLVFLGTGSFTDYFKCPACVGASKEELYGVYRDDAEHLAKMYGLTIKWIV